MVVVVEEEEEEEEEEVEEEEDIYSTRSGSEWGGNQARGAMRNWMN